MNNQPLLSVLIISIEQRLGMFSELMDVFNGQILNCNSKVEFLVEVDNGQLTKGEKRNTLLEKANGQYLCFFDDDDLPSANYLNLLTAALLQQPDCCSLKGIITWNGLNPEIFEHSIKYKIWRTNDNANYPYDVKYERPPNHLNAIKAIIAKQFMFPALNHGEDEKWSMDIANSGLLMNEIYIPEVLYHYKYTSK